MWQGGGVLLGLRDEQDAEYIPCSGARSSDWDALAILNDDLFLCFCWLGTGKRCDQTCSGHTQLFQVTRTFSRLAPLSMGFSRGSSQTRDRTWVSCLGRRVLYHWATWEAHPCIVEMPVSIGLPSRFTRCDAVVGNSVVNGVCWYLETPSGCLSYSQGCPSTVHSLQVLLEEPWRETVLEPHRNGLTSPCAGSGCFYLSPGESSAGSVSLSCSVLSDSLWPPWIVARWAPLSVKLPRQESWSGLPFPSSGDLPNPAIESGSPELQADSLSSE